MTRIQGWITAALVVVGLGAIGVWYLLSHGGDAMDRIMRGLPQVVEEAVESGYHDLPSESRAVVGTTPVAVIESFQQVGRSNAAGGPVQIYNGQWLSGIPDSLRIASYYGEIVNDGLDGEPAHIVLWMDGSTGVDGERAALRIGRDGPAIPLQSSGN